MARQCSICTHPQRAEIDKALVRNTDTKREIAKRFGIGLSALYRHLDAHIGEVIARGQRVREERTRAQTTAIVEAHEAAQDAAALDLADELRRALRRVNLLFDACDAWLRDPDDPSRYDVSARAEDIDVVYTEQQGEREVRRKKKLSELLRIIVQRRAGVAVELVETKHADPRKLLLEAAAGLRGQLELVAKLTGALDERPQVNVLVASEEWVRVRGRLVAALAPYPEARQAVVDALSDS